MAGISAGESKNTAPVDDDDKKKQKDEVEEEVEDDSEVSEDEDGQSCSDPDYQEDAIISSHEEEEVEQGNEEEEVVVEEVTLKQAEPIAKTAGSRRQKKKRRAGDDDVVDDADEGEETSTTKVKKKKKKEEHMFAKRAMAIMMTLPMVLGGLAMASEVFTQFQFDKGLVFIGGSVLGGIGALYLVLKLGMLGSFVKLTCFVAPIVFLVPTYQVYRCSPVSLNNDLMGAWFKLGSNAAAITKQSYLASECFKGHRVQAPPMLSLFQTRVNLTVNIEDLISLNEEEKSEDESAKRATSLFMLASKRSVQRKFHTLYLLVQAPRKITTFLYGAKKLGREDRERKLLSIAGSIVDIGENMLSVKKELEGMKHNIRPVVLVASKAEYINRYATFRHASYDKS